MMRTSAGAGAIIQNSNGHVFMVKIQRRDMVRWELPAGIQDTNESVFTCLYRSFEQESSFQYHVRIGRPVCLALHRSAQQKVQYFGMYFECKIEDKIAKSSTPFEIVNLPQEMRQKVIDAQFVDWRKLTRIEIHPQHYEILYKWSQNWDGAIFAVVSDADCEVDYYHRSGQLKSVLLETPEPKQNDKGLRRLFISYSKHDNRYKKNLVKHLKALDSIVTFDDEKILPGEDWDDRIKQELMQSDVVLYLVSANSIATEYIQKVELEIIEERCRNRQCILVPIVIDFCAWQETIHAQYGALPKKGVPITDKTWQNQNEAWLEVIQGIKRILKA